MNDQEIEIPRPLVQRKIRPPFAPPGPDGGVNALKKGRPGAERRGGFTPPPPPTRDGAA